jgi:hypothetical protein
MKALRFYVGKSTQERDNDGHMEEVAFGEDGHWWRRRVRYAGVSLRTQVLWDWERMGAPPKPATHRIHRYASFTGISERKDALRPEEAEGRIQGSSGPLEPRDPKAYGARLPDTPEWLALKAAKKEGKKIAPPRRKLPSNADLGKGDGRI